MFPNLDAFADIVCFASNMKKAEDLDLKQNYGREVCRRRGKKLNFTPWMSQCN